MARNHLLALFKIRKILKGHTKVMAALRKFTDGGRKLVILWGNHDAALWWPGVHAEVRKEI